MNFTAEVQLTFPEYVEYNLYVTKKRRERIAETRRMPSGVVGLTFALGFLVLIYYLTHNGAKSIPLTDIPFPLWFAIVLTICAVTFPWRRWRWHGALRKAWESSRGWSKILFDDNGMTISQRTAEYRISWDHYIRFEETNTLLFLFSDEYSAYPIPKRIFNSADELEAYRHFLRQRISGPTGAFPVVPIETTEGQK